MIMLHSPESPDSLVTLGSTSIERDKHNYSFINEIFERLALFGNETDRPIFCQRLQSIWIEEGITCQAYPTITNQILDLYKLYLLVQEKQGYLEITTNRGWKEVSTVLGFGDSGSAAYSVKRNYVRLGLLAYECRFDRTGLDPRSVIELAEMPHTIKKRKRSHPSVTTSTPRTIVKIKSPITATQTINSGHMEENSKSFVSSSIVYPTSIYRSKTRLKPEQMPIPDLSQLAYLIRGCSLGESNKYLDSLLVWLSDPRTASYFHLKQLPGLFNAILEQYLACLNELFGSKLFEESPMNDLYIEWFLQIPFQIHHDATAPISNLDRLESLFFGTHRYILKRMIMNDDENIDCHHSRYSSLMMRCSSSTVIIRNLSFIEENLFLANECRLLDIIERILKFQHDSLHEHYPYLSDQVFCSQCVHNMEMDDRTIDTIPSWTPIATEQTSTRKDPLAYHSDCEQYQWIFLLDNTLITLSNLSTAIELHHYPPLVRYRLIDTLIRWIECSLSLPNEICIPMLMEENVISNSTVAPKKTTIERKDELFVSPRQLILQILAKLCTNQMNVECILSDLFNEQWQRLSHALLSIMNRSLEETDREYCLMIIYTLCKCNRLVLQFFNNHRLCIELIFNYLDLYEQRQQQYLIATLTTCCYANSASSIQIPTNQSQDMMIDSCIQLFLLFAPMKENNTLRLFEDRLIELSSSIYFEQKFLKAFADILYILQS